MNVDEYLEGLKWAEQKKSTGCRFDSFSALVLSCPSGSPVMYHLRNSLHSTKKVTDSFPSAHKDSVSILLSSKTPSYRTQSLALLTTAYKSTHSRVQDLTTNSERKTHPHSPDDFHSPGRHERLGWPRRVGLISSRRAPHSPNDLRSSGRHERLGWPRRVGLMSSSRRSLLWSSSSSSSACMHDDIGFDIQLHCESVRKGFPFIFCIDFDR